jgi:putative (di)nucleoside polyphosphate hydrolase
MPNNKRKYRPNVAAIIISEDHPGRVLVFRRRDTSLQGWQFPQGGIEKGESPKQALKRELKEETGIKKFRILARTPQWLLYKWPPHILLKEKKYIGQKQHYFLVELNKPIEKQFRATKDFRSYQWCLPSTAIKRAIAFKRPIYRKAWRTLKSAINY